MHLLSNIYGLESELRRALFPRSAIRRSVEADSHGTANATGARATRRMGRLEIKRQQG
jgi:hypothetical protein